MHQCAIRPAFMASPAKGELGRKSICDGIVFDANLDDADAERFVIYPLQKNVGYESERPSVCSTLT